MHFTKIFVSLIGLSSFATAHDTNDNNDLARRELNDAYDDYLVARDEFIEKRELYLRAKTAAKPAAKGKTSSGGGKMLPPGVCREPLTGLGWYCTRKGGRHEQCGPMCYNPNGICACQY